MNKFYFYLVLILILVVYYLYNKKKNKQLKEEIKLLIKQGSIYSSESEKITNPVLKFEKGVFGLTYLKTLEDNYNINKINKLSDVDFKIFKKNIINNYLKSRKELNNFCKLKNNDETYLEDISIKI